MGRILRINQLRIPERLVQEAATAIRNGKIILYPTETTYGIGCDALNDRAILRVFAAKERPQTKPVLVLADTLRMVRTLVTEIPPPALALMKRFWPGPLTILLPPRETVHSAITAGTGKIGVRIPGNRFCLRVIAACKTPLLSTSANISGEPEAHRFEVLKDQFSDIVDLLIDAGDLPPSPPSTVVDISEGRMSVVREGAITKAALLRFFN